MTVDETTQKWWVLSLVVAFGAAGLWGCDSSTSGDDVENEHQEFYSPFVIEGDGDLRFNSISFTDVGIQQPEPEPADQFLLEAIAESLAYEIEGHPDLDFAPRVEYDEAQLQDENHLACDRDHLYVAVWRGYEPDRWGYSLWSGCHERQKFEWKEIEDPDSEFDDTIEWVEPMTRSIADSIHEAHRQDCFSAIC